MLTSHLLLFVMMGFAPPSHATGKDPKLTRRGFLAGSASAALVAGQPNTVIGALEHALAMSAEPVFMARVAELIAERTGEMFRLTPRSLFEMVVPNPSHSFLDSTSQELPFITLPVQVPTAHFATTIAQLESNLARQFPFTPAQIRARGEQLRGTDRLEELVARPIWTFTGAPILRRNYDLGERFDQAYVAGLAAVHPEYGKQVEARWQKLRLIGETFISDRKTWRRAFWRRQFDYNDSLITAWLMEPLQAAENGMSAYELYIQSLQRRSNSEGMLDRFGEFADTASEALADLEDRLALLHKMDIEAVYEATSFLLRPRLDHPWSKDGYCLRAYEVPNAAYVRDVLTKIREIAPVIADEIESASYRLEHDPGFRYAIRIAISPEALAALEDELSARYPEAYGRLRDAFADGHPITPPPADSPEEAIRRMLQTKKRLWTSTSRLHALSNGSSSHPRRRGDDGRCSCFAG